MHTVAEINLSNKDDHILSKVNQTQVPRYQRYSHNITLQKQTEMQTI